MTPHIMTPHIMTPEEQATRTLRERADVVAALLLASVRGQAVQPVTVRRASGPLRVSICIEPDATDEPDPASAVRRLSPVEQKMWDALSGGRVLLGKNLATAAGFPTYNREAKVIISNMAAAGTLIHLGPKEGYRRGSLQPLSQPQ